MIELYEKKLKSLLKKIDSNPQMKQQYSSKWHRIVNFLYNNTGLKIAKVAKSGSFAKHTEYSDSDLDVIFCTSPDYNLHEMQVYLEEKLIPIFGKIADIKIGAHAVHIDFRNPEVNIDLVYITQREFDTEFEVIKEFSRIAPVQKDSIKLAKYAFDKAGISKIKGYQIEKAWLQFNYTSLKDLTFHIIKFFTGRIRKIGLEVNDILKYLK